MEWTLVNEITFLAIQECLQPLLVEDGVLYPLLLLNLFDGAEVTDSINLCLRFLVSLLLLVAEDHFALGFGVLDAA